MKMGLQNLVRLLYCASRFLVVACLLLPLMLRAQHYISMEQVEECNQDTMYITIESDNEISSYSSDAPYFIQDSRIGVVATENMVFTATSDYYEENLIYNGDFELGNVGFLSSYEKVVELYRFNQYTITKSPAAISTYLASKKDHTSGSGNMMAVDGDTIGLPFYETISDVEIGSEYEISFWLSNAHQTYQSDTPSIDTDPSSIFLLSLNGEDITDSLRLPDDTTWVQFKTNFVAKDKSVHISLRTVLKKLKGNDFVMDDIVLRKRSSISESIVLVPCNDYPVFTPDGDGMYDTFFIDRVGKAQIISLSGDIIKELDVPAQWDGTNEDHVLMSAGFYAIIINDSEVLRVSLVR